MSVPANIEMVEEDAADLQFPKENEIIRVTASKNTTYKRVARSHRHLQHNHRHRHPYKTHITVNAPCGKCRQELREPFIYCVECTESFCTRCFAHGSETKAHRSWHSYAIHHDRLEVFAGANNWTARDERKLLDLLMSHGYGNWDDISRLLQSHSPDEVRDHYSDHYFNGMVGRMCGLMHEVYEPIRVPRLCKLKSLHPPRFHNDTAGARALSGYRCARGDFDTPYDNSAESIVSNLSLACWGPDEIELGETLNVAMVNVYNHRLKERHRRYGIMREHGLLVVNKTLGWWSMHAETLGKSSSNCSGRFIAFMQLMHAIAFDALVEALQYGHDLKKYCMRLHELRQNGVTTMEGGVSYFQLKMNRHCHLSKYRQLQGKYDWRQFVSNPSAGGGIAINGPNGFQFVSNSQHMPRRKALPLDIVGMPGFVNLTEEEKKLCSEIRLMPVDYLGYKTVLQGENSRSGYLRLAEARRLIKIDVNKTRQMYDFLLQHGFINKPFSV